MSTQQRLDSPSLLGLALPQTQSRPVARSVQVARPVYRPFGYQFDTGEQIVFALLGVTAWVLIFLVFL